MGEPAHHRFEVVRQVGAGAFGTVYEARDHQEGGTVALKVLHSTQRDLARFKREAHVLSALDHPGIVRYVDHGLDAAGHAYLAMEWLRGCTLDERLEQGVLPLSEVARLGKDIASALLAALEVGAIHRDIKPANLFLPEDDVAGVKVLDFGLARMDDDGSAQLTQTGAMLGTPAYMSPEQAHGESALSFRSDIFSLGVVMYVALTGRLPFEGPNPMATLMKVCVEEPEPVSTHRRDTPEELSSLVQRMLAKKPDQRPDYIEIGRELTNLLAEDALGDQSRILTLEPSNDTGPLPSLRARSEQRVLCALFVGAGRSPVENLEAQLSQLFFDCGGYGHRLLDGTRVVMLDGQLAASDQAVAAAQCALAIQALLPDSPIALCTGRAVVDEAAPVGELIDRGTAMLRRARPGAVRLDDDSASLLASRFSLIDRGDCHELGSEQRESSSPRGSHLTMFVGRESELMQLHVLFSECLEERAARAVLVTAAAGAGKSRLRHEWRRRLDLLEEDFEVLVGRGDSVCQAVRFGVLLPVLRSWAGITSEDPAEVQCGKIRAAAERLLPEAQALRTAEFLGEMLGVRFPAQGREALQAARRDPQLMADWVLESWLAWVEGMCRQRPLLLLVEDLHWADPASVRFLEAALRVAEGLPLLVVAFARPELHETMPRLWAGRDVHEIRLRKLGTRACERMLAHRLGDRLGEEARTRLVQLADGNPFFLEELARVHAVCPDTPELPSSVLGIVQIRLDALGDDAKLILRAASVFGHSFHLGGISALLHAHTARLDLEAELGKLEELDVVRQKPERGAHEYSFRHALIGDAAYRLLTEDDRTLGHRLAARWLQQQELTPPALLAEHYERGACPDQAAHWYARASREAMEGGTMEEVVRLGKRCVECGVQGEAMGEAASLVAEALSWMGQDAESREWGERARRVLAADAAGWWRATQVVVISEMRREGGGARELSEEMVAQLRPGEWTPECAVALGWVAGEALNRTQPDVAAPILDLFPEPLPVELGGPATGLVELARACRASVEGDVSANVVFARRAVEACRATGASNLLSVSLNHLGTALLEVGQIEEAELTFQEGFSLSRRLGAELSALVLQTNLGMVLRYCGDADRAKQQLQCALSGFRQRDLQMHEAYVLTELARLECVAGEFSLALTYGRSAAELGGGDPQIVAVARAVLSQGMLGLDDQEGAQHWAQLALEVVREHALVEEVGVVWVAAIVAARACGFAAQARSLAIEARGELLARADAIRDQALRSSFLGSVPDNRRLLQLAAELCS